MKQLCLNQPDLKMGRSGGIGRKERRGEDRRRDEREGEEKLAELKREGEY